MDSSISRGSFPDEEDDLGLQHDKNNGNTGHSEDISSLIEDAIKGMRERTRSSNVGTNNYLESEGLNQEECNQEESKLVGVVHNVAFDTDHQYGYAAATAEEIRLGHEISVNANNEPFIIDSDVLGADDVYTEEVLDVTKKSSYDTSCFNNISRNDSIEELPSSNKRASVQNLKELNVTLIKSLKISDVNKVESTSPLSVHKSVLPQTGNLMKLKDFYESIAPNLADDDRNDSQDASEETSFSSTENSGLIDEKMPVLVNEKNVVIKPSYTDDDRSPPKLVPENIFVNEQVIGVVHPFNHESNLNCDNQVNNISGVSIISNNRKPISPSSDVITRNRLRKQEGYRTVMLKQDSSKPMAIPTILNGSVDKSNFANKEGNMCLGISSGNHYRIASKNIKHEKNVNEFPYDSRLPLTVQIHTVDKVIEKDKSLPYKFDYYEEAHNHSDKSCNTQNEYIPNGQPVVSDIIRNAECDDQELMENKSNINYRKVCNAQTNKVVVNERKKCLRSNSPFIKSTLPSMPILLSTTGEETGKKRETSKKTNHKNINRKLTPTRSVATPLRSFQRLPINESSSSLIILNSNKKPVPKNKTKSNQDKLIIRESITNENAVFPVKQQVITHRSLRKKELNKEITKSIIKDDLIKNKLNNIKPKDIHSPDLISPSLETLTNDQKETDNCFKTFDNLLTDFDLDKTQANSLDESVHSLETFIKDPTSAFYNIYKRPTTDILEVLPGADLFVGDIADKEIIISSADVSILKSDMLEEGTEPTLEDGPLSTILNFFDKDLNSSKEALESKQNEIITNSETFSKEDKIILKKPKVIINVDDEKSSAIDLFDSVKEIDSDTKRKEVGCSMSSSNMVNHDKTKYEALDNYVTAKNKIFLTAIAPQSKEYDDSKNSLLSEFEKLDQILDRELANSIGEDINSDSSKNSPLPPSVSKENQDLNKTQSDGTVIEENLQADISDKKSKLSQDRVNVSSEIQVNPRDELSSEEVDIIMNGKSSDYQKGNQSDEDYSSNEENELGADGKPIGENMSYRKEKSSKSDNKGFRDDYLEDISDGDFEIDDDFEESKLPTRKKSTDGRNAPPYRKCQFTRSNVADTSRVHRIENVPLQREAIKCHIDSNPKYSKDSSHVKSTSAYKNNNTYQRKDINHSKTNSKHKKRIRSKKHKNTNALKTPIVDNKVLKSETAKKQFHTTSVVKITAAPVELNKISNGRLSPSVVDGNSKPCRTHKDFTTINQGSICKRMQEDKAEIAKFSKLSNKDKPLSKVDESGLKPNLQISACIKNRNENKDNLIVKGLTTSMSAIGLSPEVKKDSITKQMVNSPRRSKRNELRDKIVGLEVDIKKLKSEMNASNEHFDKRVLKSDENTVTETKNSDSLLSCSSKIETETIDDNVDAQLEIELSSCKNNSDFHNSELTKFEPKESACSLSIEQKHSYSEITTDNNLSHSSKSDIGSVTYTETKASTNDGVNVDCNEKAILSSETIIPSASKNVNNSSSIEIQENFTLTGDERTSPGVKGELSSLELVTKNSESKSFGNGVGSEADSELVSNKIHSCEADKSSFEAEKNYNKSHVLNENEIEKLNKSIAINEINADSKSTENEDKLKNRLLESSPVGKISDASNISSGNSASETESANQMIEINSEDHKSPANPPVVMNQPGLDNEFVTLQAQQESFVVELTDKKSVLMTVFSFTDQECDKLNSETKNIELCPSDTVTMNNEDKNFSDEVRKSVAANEETSQHNNLQVLNEIEINDNIQVCNNVSNSVAKIKYKNSVSDSVESMVNLKKTAQSETIKLNISKKTVVENTERTGNIENCNKNDMNPNRTTNEVINATGTAGINEGLSVNDKTNCRNAGETIETFKITRSVCYESIEKHKTVGNVIQFVNDDEDVNAKTIYPSTEATTESDDAKICSESVIPTVSDDGTNVTEKTFSEKLQSIENFSDERNVISSTETTNNSENDEKPESAECVNLTLVEEDEGNIHSNTTDESRKEIEINKDDGKLHSESVIPTIDDVIDDTEKLQSIESVKGNTSVVKTTNQIINITEKTISENTSENDGEPLSTESISLPVVDENVDSNTTVQSTKATETNDTKLHSESVIPTLTDNVINDDEKTFSKKIEGVSRDKNINSVAETTDRIGKVTGTTEKIFSEINSESDGKPHGNSVNVNSSVGDEIIYVPMASNHHVNSDEPGDNSCVTTTVDNKNGKNDSKKTCDDYIGMDTPDTVTEISQASETEKIPDIENYINIIKETNSDKLPSAESVSGDVNVSIIEETTSLESFSDKERGVNITGQKSNENPNQQCTKSVEPIISEMDSIDASENVEGKLCIENVNEPAGDGDKSEKQICKESVDQTIDEEEAINVSCCLENSTENTSSKNVVDATTLPSGNTVVVADDNAALINEIECDPGLLSAKEETLIPDSNIPVEDQYKKSEGNDKLGNSNMLFSDNIVEEILDTSGKLCNFKRNNLESILSGIRSRNAMIKKSIGLAESEFKKFEESEVIGSERVIGTYDTHSSSSSSLIPETHSVCPSDPENSKFPEALIESQICNDSVQPVHENKIPEKSIVDSPVDKSHYPLITIDNVTDPASKLNNATLAEGIAVDLTTNSSSEVGGKDVSNDHVGTVDSEELLDDFAEDTSAPVDSETSYNDGNIEEENDTDFVANKNTIEAEADSTDNQSVKTSIEPNSLVNNKPGNFIQVFAKYIDTNNRFQTDTTVCISLGSSDPGNEIEEIAPLNLKTDTNSLKQQEGFPLPHSSAVENHKPSVDSTDSNLSNDTHVKLTNSEIKSGSSKNESSQLPVDDDYQDSEIVKNMSDFSDNEKVPDTCSTLSISVSKNLDPENQANISNNSDSLKTTIDNQVSLLSETINNNVNHDEKDPQADSTINKSTSHINTEDSAIEYSNYSGADSLEQNVNKVEGHRKETNTDNFCDQRNIELLVLNNGSNMPSSDTEEQLKLEVTEESSVILDLRSSISGSDNSSGVENDTKPIAHETASSSQQQSVTEVEPLSSPDDSNLSYITKENPDYPKLGEENCENDGEEIHESEENDESSVILDQRSLISGSDNSFSGVGNDTKQVALETASSSQQKTEVVSVSLSIDDSNLSYISKESPEYPKLGEENCENDGEEIHESEENCRNDGVEIHESEETCENDGEEIHESEENCENDGEEIHESEETCENDGEEIHESEETCENDGEELHESEENCRNDGVEIHESEETCEKDGEEIHESEETCENDGEEIHESEETCEKDGEEIHESEETCENDGEEIHESEETCENDGEEIHESEETCEKDGEEIHESEETCENDGEEIHESEETCEKDGEEIHESEETCEKDGEELHESEENCENDGEEIHESEENDESSVILDQRSLISGSDNSLSGVGNDTKKVAHETASTSQQKTEVVSVSLSTDDSNLSYISKENPEYPKLGEENCENDGEELHESEETCENDGEEIHESEETCENDGEEIHESEENDESSVILDQRSLISGSDNSFSAVGNYTKQVAHEIASSSQQQSVTEAVSVSLSTDDSNLSYITENSEHQKLGEKNCENDGDEIHESEENDESSVILDQRSLISGSDNSFSGVENDTKQVAHETASSSQHQSVTEAVSVSFSPDDSNLSYNTKENPEDLKLSEENCENDGEEIHEYKETDTINSNRHSDSTSPDSTEPDFLGFEDIESECHEKSNSEESIENQNCSQTDDSDSKPEEQPASNVEVTNYSILVDPTGSKFPPLKTSEVNKIILGECFNKNDFTVNSTNEEIIPFFSKNKKEDDNIVSSSIVQNQCSEINNEIFESSSVNPDLSKINQDYTIKVCKEVKIILEKINFSNDSSSTNHAPNSEIVEHKRKRHLLSQNKGIKRFSDTSFNEEEPPNKVILFRSSKLVKDTCSVNKTKKSQGRYNFRRKNTILQKEKSDVSAIGNICPVSVLLTRLNSFSSISECMHKNKVKRVFIPSDIYNCFEKDTCQPSVYSDLEIICTKSHERNSRFKRRRRKTSDDESDSDHHSSENQLNLRPRHLNKRTKQDKDLKNIQRNWNLRNVTSTKHKGLSESSSVPETTVSSTVSATVSTCKRHHESVIGNEASPKRPNLDNNGCFSRNKPPKAVNYTTIKNPTLAKEPPCTVPPAEIDASGSRVHGGMLKVGDTMKEILINFVRERLSQDQGHPLDEEDEDSDDDFFGFEPPCECLFDSSISQSCTGDCFFSRVKYKLCCLNRISKISLENSSLPRRTEKFRTFRSSRQELNEEQDHHLRGSKVIGRQQEEASASSKPFRDPGVCYMSLEARSPKNEKSFKLKGSDCLEEGYSQLVSSNNVEVPNDKRTRFIAQKIETPSSSTETDNSQEEDSESSS